MDELKGHRMFSTRKLLMTLLLACGHATAHAETPPVQAVYLDVCVTEQNVDRIGKKVHEPVMRALRTLPGTGDITGAATHGKAQFQIEFKDGATRNDRAMVEEAVERLAFGPDVEVLSVLVELAQPRDDRLFVGRIACIEHLRRRRGS
jgi:hypothetical protein